MEIRKLWMTQDFDMPDSWNQNRVQRLLDIMQLGNESTIINFAQNKIDFSKLETKKIIKENGLENGKRTFREVKLFTSSELSRLHLIRCLVGENLSKNAHLQDKIDWLQKSKIDSIAETADDMNKMEATILQNQRTMRANKEEIARLKTEIEQLQLIVRLHKDESDGHEDPDEDWMEDNEVEENGMVGKRISPYIGVASTQNPYCITIATKRKLDEFQCEVWTLPELLQMEESQLVKEFDKWYEAGFAASLPSSVIWDDLEQQFTAHFSQFYGDADQIEMKWVTAWREYWLIVALFGKPKEIPQKLIDNQSELPNGQGLIGIDEQNLKEMDRLLGTRESFIKFAKKRCAIAED